MAATVNGFLDATVSSEDKSFWENKGYDLEGIGRALVSNLRGEDVQGGSSITQQLVKNVLIDPEDRIVSEEGPTLQDYERKARELLLAMEISRRYEKERILEWYLNTNFYGNLAYGIEAAARVYFGKTSGELTLPEAAMLAPIPQYPAQNPIDNPPEAIKRQHLVLEFMLRDGYVTEEQMVQAKFTPLVYAGGVEERYDIVAPHFAIYARKELEEARRLQIESIAAKRLGDPNEFGAFCAFLCSQHAGFVSGQNIHLDGGSYPSLI